MLWTGEVATRGKIPTLSCVPKRNLFGKKYRFIEQLETINVIDVFNYAVNYMSVVY